MTGQLIHESSPPTPLRTLGGQLFEEFFQSIIDQDGFDETQKAELVTYLEGAMEKRDRLGEFIARLTAEAEAIKNEESRLAARRKGFEKIAGNVRDSIHQQMLDWQVKKVAGKLFTFAIKSNPPSVEITDESQIPGDYLDYKPQVDKTKVKEALKAGQSIPGARLITDRTRLEVL
jgi:hypothetical protein